MCVNKTKRNEIIEQLISYIVLTPDDHPPEIVAVAEELLKLELEKHDRINKKVKGE